jgi:hypothetical protein
MGIPTPTVLGDGGQPGEFVTLRWPRTTLRVEGRLESVGDVQAGGALVRTGHLSLKESNVGT